MKRIDEDKQRFIDAGVEPVETTCGHCGGKMYYHPELYELLMCGPYYHLECSEEMLREFLKKIGDKLGRTEYTSVSKTD